MDEEPNEFGSKKRKHLVENFNLNEEIVPKKEMGFVENINQNEEIPKLVSKMREDLVETINLNDTLWNELRRRKVVSAFDRDQIEREGTMEDQVDRLLELLENCPAEDFKEFIMSLIMTNQKHVVVLLRLGKEKEADIGGMVLRSQGRKKVKFTMQSSTVSMTEASVSILMNPERKKLLQVPENRKRLIEKMNLDGKVWSALIEEKIILKDEANTIQASNKSGKEQIAPLLDHLMRRPNKDFDIFCQILEKNGKQNAFNEIRRAEMIEIREAKMTKKGLKSVPKSNQ